MMPLLKQQHHFEFPASTEQLENLGLFVQQHCSNAESVMLVELAINEIAVNAIVHGLAQQCKVSVGHHESLLTVVFMDNGVPFNLLQQKALPSGELREHGYGMQLIQVAQREMRYMRTENWNVLEIDFALGKEKI